MMSCRLSVVVEPVVKLLGEPTLFLLLVTHHLLKSMHGVHLHLPYRLGLLFGLVDCPFE
mgnify:FL=1